MRSCQARPRSASGSAPVNSSQPAVDEQPLPARPVGPDQRRCRVGHRLEAALGFPAGPTERHPTVDACPQLTGGERGDQVVVRAGPQPLDGGLGSGACRHEHDRHERRARVAPQGGDQLQAAQPRKGDVGQDEVRRIGHRRRQRGRPVRGGLDAVRAAEEPHEVGAHVRVVVDHQDPPRAGVVGQGGPRRGRRIAGVRQPPQRLRDRLGAQLRMVAGDPGGRQVVAAERDGDVDGEPGARPVRGSSVRRHRAAQQPHQLGDQGQPDPAVLGLHPGRAGRGDAQHRGAVLAAEPDRDPPAGGDGEGVGEQRGNHLFPHRAVHDGGFAQVRAVEVQRQAGVLDRRPEHVDQTGGERCQVDGLEVRVDLPRVQPGELQQPVDHPAQALRVAVHQLQVRAQRRAGRRRVAQLRDRAEDQAQRCAELVADPGEERRLGAVQLGEVLGAPLLRGEGARRDGRRGDVVAHQLEERSVLVVEREVGAHPGDEHAGGPVDAGAEGQDDGGVERRLVVPVAAEQPRTQRAGAAEPPVGQRAGQAGDDRAAAGRQYLVQDGGPEAVAVHARRREGPARHDALGGHQTGPAALVVGEVQHRGGHVGAVAREHVDRGDGRRLRVGDAAQPGELAQRAQPPLADHPTGGLGARAEHPVRARLRRTDGAEGEGEPGLLRPAPAGQQHRQVLMEDRLARQRVGQRRLQARPHLGPGGLEGRRQRLRVPGTEHRGVGVVVEQRPLRTCGDVHRQL